MTRTNCRWWVRGVAVTTLAIGAAACASTGQAPDRGTVDAAIRSRGLSGIRVEGTAPLPPDVVRRRRADVAGSRRDRPVEQPVVSGDPRRSRDRPRGPGRGRPAAQSCLLPPLPLGSQTARMDAPVSLRRLVATTPARRRGPAQRPGGRRAARVGRADARGTDADGARGGADCRSASATHHRNHRARAAADRHYRSAPEGWGHQRAGSPVGAQRRGSRPGRAPGRRARPESRPSHPGRDHRTRSGRTAAARPE